MAYKLTTVAACRVAAIDRQRLNEFIASGDYPCAPETTPGRSRLFDEAALITLFIFARELDHNTRPSVAGQIALRIAKGLVEDPNAESISIVRQIGVSRSFYAPGQPSSKDIFGGGPSLSVTEYGIQAVRKLVLQGIEEERAVIGEED